MNVASVPSPGGPNAFILAEVDNPRAGSHDIVIRITAAGVNRADVLQREGRYPPPPGAPDWPGLEVAGIVLEAGPEAQGWAAGDRVCALLPGGGYAERCAVDASLALPVPAGLTDVEAAGLMEAACTAVSNLDVAAASAGETVLIHGGSGGVGSLAIPIAKARGLRVITTAGGAERAARCLTLGADVALDHHGDWSAELAALGGADVILDVAGAGALSANLAALRTGGRLVVIGMMRGARGELDLGTLLAKRASLIGTTLRSRPLAERAAIVARVREEVWPLVPHAVRPLIHATFPLARVSDAHRALESGEVFGKVVLSVA